MLDLFLDSLSPVGAWDVTAFGSDEAADWAFDLQESDAPVSFIESALDLAKGSDYLEAPDASRVVAAATIVAAAGRKEAPGLPGDLSHWLRGKEDSLTPLAPKALIALQRGRSESCELRELWEEADDFAAWCKDLDAITTSLNEMS